MMKKILLVAASLLMLAGCGVGSYSVTTGKPDEASISFTTPEKKAYDVVVCIDGQVFDVKAVNEKVFRAERNIKQTALNTITLAPGTHEVTVTRDGQNVFTKKLFISAQEHRIVAL